MPRYRFRIPVRAVGHYRLPDGDTIAGDIVVQGIEGASYHAHISPLIAETAQEAFNHAQAEVNDLLSYLALTGEAAGFILDGKDGVQGRNLDHLEERKTERKTGQRGKRVRTI